MHNQSKQLIRITLFPKNYSKPTGGDTENIYEVKKNHYTTKINLLRIA